MPTMTAERADPTARASRLLLLWNDLARQHVSMGGGCACGIGGVTVRLEDFEHDIADYLCAEAQRLGNAEVLALLSRHVRMDDPAPDEIGKVLTMLAATEDRVPESAADWILSRLDRTLTSFARLHGGAKGGSS